MRLNVRLASATSMMLAAMLLIFAGVTTSAATAKQPDGGLAATVAAPVSPAHAQALKKCKKIQGVSKKRINKIRKANKRKLKRMTRSGASAAKLRKVKKTNKRRLKGIAKKNKAKTKKRNACIKRANERFRVKPTDPPVDPPKPPVPPKTQCAKAAPAPFTACGSVGEAYVVDAVPGTQLELLNKDGSVVDTGTVDSLGSKIFYMVSPGADYMVRQTGGTPATSAPFDVLAPDDNPEPSFYTGDDKTLKEGLNYITMRDGVQLAMTVRLPSGMDIDDGPFPTFIEHSGYETAGPHDALPALLTGTSDPLAPASSTAVGSIVGNLLGFATVSVQMRGSGCSGGAFDLFGLPTTYDGYDMVETVAAQDWVRGNPGMSGISFSGISQLFAAGTQPPHLAAIAPMSITDDLYMGTGMPGGIFNKGFALSWIKERMEDAEPAPEGGQRWAREMILNGDPEAADPSPDKRCLDNQKLRLQTRDAVQLIEENPYRTPSLFDDRSPGAWMKRINVPTFFASQFQDEQTGGRFAESLGGMSNNPNVWMVLQNGPHVDSLGPSVITNWFEFMKLFVADEIPVVDPFIIEMSGFLYDAIAPAAGSLPVPQSQFAEYTDVDQARADFKEQPRVRLLMDNGNAVPGTLGAIGADWEMGFDDWPIPEMTPTTYYPGDGGALTTTKPGSESTVEYTADPSARPKQSLSGAGGGIGGGDEAWKGQPNYNWVPVANGKGVGFTTPALGSDMIIAGTSALDVYLKSSAADTDLQVTLSEVRPDGKETYVQNGWLRASHRKVDPEISLVNDPAPTHLEEDAAPLPAGQYSLVRVPIFPVAHAFRAGSKVRVTVQGVGGDRPIWDFATVDDGTAENEIILGGERAAKLILPVIPGENAQGTPLPAPTALRGQPSRNYVPAANGG